MTNATLFYFHDPMCSWCYGFADTMREVERRLPALPGAINARYIVGGLAPDSDEPMPAAMAAHIQEAWRQVARRCGVSFNFDFWRIAKPRRSTYPACRAVIIAGDKGREMTAAIQTAYYQEAKNPSDIDALRDCADAIGLPAAEFTARLQSPAVAEEFARQLNFTRQCGVAGFPSLRLQVGKKMFNIPALYGDADGIIKAIESVVSVKS